MIQLDCSDWEKRRLLFAPLHNLPAHPFGHSLQAKLDIVGFSCFCFSVLNVPQDEDKATFEFILNAIWYLRNFLKKFICHLNIHDRLLSGKRQQVCKIFFLWQSTQSNSQTLQKTCRISFATHAPLHHIPSKGARLSDSRLVIAVYSSAVPGQSTSSQGRAAVGRSQQL